VSADVLDIARYLVNNSTEKMLQDAINEVHEDLEELNLNQLREFKNAKGEFLADIGGDYSEETQFLKGLGARDVNLFDTGDYYDSYEVSGTKSGNIFIDSDPTEGDKDLETRYGKDLEGFNDENLIIANELIEKAVWDKAEKSL
jgi:hypothetical protein